MTRKGKRPRGRSHEAVRRRRNGDRARGPTPLLAPSVDCTSVLGSLRLPFSAHVRVPRRDGSPRPARLPFLERQRGKLAATRTYEMLGAPGRIRTCDLKIRSLLLYPAELRAHGKASIRKGRDGAGDGSRTRDPQLGRLMLYQLSYSRPRRLVGTARFELATPCSQSRCATRLRHVPRAAPVYRMATGGTRSPALQSPRYGSVSAWPGWSDEPFSRFDVLIAYTAARRSMPVPYSAAAIVQSSSPACTV